MPELPEMRLNYERAELCESNLLADPVEQFRSWFEIAEKAGIAEPNAMTLATVDANGEVSARTVLLKGLDDRGLSFFTNYESRKGRNLAANPSAALTFYWQALERQVCVRGRAEKLSGSDSDAYFAARPYGSQIGAWASDQSQPAESREVLENRETEFREKFPEGEVTRPPHWGGYRVVPLAMEFWQGRPGRLHDRFGYASRERKFALEAQPAKSLRRIGFSDG